MNIAIILIILLVGSLTTYMAGNRFASKLAILFSGFAAVFTIAILLKYGIAGTDYAAEWVANPRIVFALNADGLALAMLLLVTILVPIILMTGSATEIKNERTFYALILFMEFAMVGAFLSSDALLYYIFWELSLLPIYFLTALWGVGEIAKRRKAAMTFFLYTFAGSLFMLAAIVYLSTKAGSFRLEDFYALQLSSTEQFWIFIAFFLAYAIKIPIFPFHTWMANVYQKAPSMGTMLLAALMSKMGIYSIIRWQLPLTPEAALSLQPVILILCLTGAVYGCFMALRQDHIKRFFAYASMSHMGMLAAGAYSLSLAGLEGATSLMIAHGFGIVALFFAADIIMKRRETASLSQLGGIKNVAPQFSIVLFLSLLASISVPLSYNFVGELMVLFSLYQIHIAYALFGGITLFLGAFYILRMYQHAILGPTSKEPFRDLVIKEKILFTVLLGVLLFFGIYSKPITELIAPSLQEIAVYFN